MSLLLVRLSRIQVGKILVLQTYYRKEDNNKKIKFIHLYSINIEIRLTANEPNWLHLSKEELLNKLISENIDSSAGM